MKFPERWSSMLIIVSMATGRPTEPSSYHDLSWETCSSHVALEVSVLSQTGPLNRLLEVFLCLLGATLKGLGLALI
jgi:hypothetical protein